MQIFRNIALAFLAMWIVFVGIIYHEMRQPPAEFAAFIAKMPGPLFMVLPFETLWQNARSGALRVGDDAPDFHLKTVDKSFEVSLSGFRGSKPVVLIFGSYT